VSFARQVNDAIKSADDTEAAARALLEILESYDVGAGSAGLSALEAKPDLAISALQLSELSRGFEAHCKKRFEERSFETAALGRPPLDLAFMLFARLLEQHHVQALLRRAKSAVLISAVSQVELRGQAGAERAVGEPRDLLGVERLAERLPQQAQVQAELSWEWRRPLAGSDKASLLTLVEAVFV
jgi:hypothetical protein